ncbi:CG15705, partial [Drosophila busckii]
YDYMKYGKKKKKGYALPKKHVSFKRVVELITFTEDWKIKSRTEGNLRSEEEQVRLAVQNL